MSSSSATKSFRKIEPFPKNFLSLAPTTSQSYPTNQAAAPAAAPSTAPAAAAPRRSSSTSTTSSEANKSLRFLKLGPVHGGEHPGDHKGDWHEVTNEVAVE